jgi:hypothetical protein
MRLNGREVGEFDAAVARFDADLIIAANGSSAAVGARRLRRRAVTVYRNALDFAAGHPFDPRWFLLALIVDAFVARVGNGPHTPEVVAALKRLTLLRVVDDIPMPQNSELAFYRPAL